jgi:predicted dehydrogenase
VITALVVGGGSIGKRHLRNLLASGRSVAVVETRADRRAEIAAKHPEARLFPTLEAALAAERYQAGFVCLPTAYHLEPALALARRGIHLFVEKPLSHTLEGIPELLDLVRQQGLTAMTGFCMRFFQPLMKAKELLDAGRIGRLVTARSFTGVYLPDWHPYEDYRSFYMARKDQGGGVLLDECHAFDWMQWLCGPITGVSAVVGTFSDLEVDTDDVCEVIARFGDRAAGSIHLDMVDRSSRSQVDLIGTDGTVLVDFRNHTVRAWNQEGRDWEVFTIDPSYEQMYVDEIDHFFRCIERGEKPVVDLREGYQVQRVIDACARSSATGRWVAVD